ncbi:hypothetical protein BpHYR1_021036 [Brachionus plicatilis]|uniref:Uncharacterized protein n=1 Tax=Brachionus plicatilis TaxID=10195 RepID=A0A3M7R7I6_BRAPC|nr:hypothetical protein BpHYR1_021036 [Brachionus plicatilis]
MKLYGSTEGIFLTYNRTNLPKIKADFVTMHDLILADSDGNEFKTYTALDRLKEEICNIELSSIRTFRHHEDQFEILYAGNKTLIVYVRDGIIFVPNCKTSYSVEVENYDGCTRDPKVSFELSGKRNTGYLKQSTSKNQNLVNEDFDKSYYYRGLPLGLSHFINWLKNSMRNVLLVIISGLIFSFIIIIVLFFICVKCNCIALLKKAIEESTLRKNDSIPLTESGGKVTAETENNKEITETSIKEILLTSCLNYKPVFLTRTHGILVLSFINPPYKHTLILVALNNNNKKKEQVKAKTCLKLDNCDAAD